MFDNNEYGFTKEHVNELMQKLLQFVNPGYGYIYQMDFSLGPAFYNWGVIYGNAAISEEEKKLISKW